MLSCLSIFAVLTLISGLWLILLTSTGSAYNASSVLSAGMATPPPARARARTRLHRPPSWAAKPRKAVAFSCTPAPGSRHTGCHPRRQVMSGASFAYNLQRNGSKSKEYITVCMETIPIKNSLSFVSRAPCITCRDGAGHDSGPSPIEGVAAGSPKHTKSRFSSSTGTPNVVCLLPSPAAQVCPFAPAPCRCS